MTLIEMMFFVFIVIVLGVWAVNSLIKYVKRKNPYM